MGCFSPRRYGTSGCIPAVLKRTEASFSGTSWSRWDNGVIFWFEKIEVLLTKLCMKLFAWAVLYDFSGCFQGLFYKAQIAIQRKNEKLMPMLYTVHTDGWSRGNPGPSGCAFVVSQWSKVSRNWEILSSERRPIIRQNTWELSSDSTAAAEALR
jgi:hypothetical protein